MRTPSPSTSLPSLCAALFAANATSSLAYAQAALPIYDYTSAPPVSPELSVLSPDPTEAPWFENWDLWMWTDSGQFVTLQFLTSSFGMGIENQGSARMISVEPWATNPESDNAPGVHRADRGFNGDRGDWGWDEDAPLNVFFQDCHIRGDGQTFEIAMRGRDHRLWFEGTFTATAPLWQPGDGLLEYDYSRQMRYSLQVLPRLHFDGRINVQDGRDAPANWQPVQGVAVLQHSWTNAFPFSVSQRWSRFRAIRPDGLTIHFEQMLTPEEFGSVPVSWLLVTYDEEVVFASNDVDFIPLQVTDRQMGRRHYAVPDTYQIVASSGTDQVVIEVQSASLVSAEDPLRLLDRMLRAFLSNIMSPFDFELSNRYVAELTIGGRQIHAEGAGWSSFGFPKGTLDN
jgi:hypothetical protein